MLLGIFRHSPGRCHPAPSQSITQMAPCDTLPFQAGGKLLPGGLAQFREIKRVGIPADDPIPPCAPQRFGAIRL
jgi:hypothetical protein